MTSIIYHNNTPIREFATLQHAKGFLPILEANNRHKGIKGIKYHIRENKLIMGQFKSIITDNMERHV